MLFIHLFRIIAVVKLKDECSIDRFYNHNAVWWHSFPLFNRFCTTLICNRHIIFAVTVCNLVDCGPVASTLSEMCVCVNCRLSTYLVSWPPTVGRWWKNSSSVCSVRQSTRRSMFPRNISVTLLNPSNRRLTPFYSISNTSITSVRLPANSRQGDQLLLRRR